MKHGTAAASGLLQAFRQLTLSSSASSSTTTQRLATANPLRSLCLGTTARGPIASSLGARRTFSATAAAQGNWLEPSINRKFRMMKGRPRVATGGSTKGTTVVWGDYGLRMRDHHRRITAKQLKVAEDTIKQRLRGQRYRLYKRVNCNIGVFVSGNEMRMGKGKGSFDHWVARVAVNKIIFEIRGELHEAVVRDAFRLAGNKMPGEYEFVKKGDPPVVGITKLENGLTLEDLKRPRRTPPVVSTPAGAPSPAAPSP